MFNCREVSRKVSASLDGQLSMSQRMLLWMHLAMCRYCMRFKHQLLMVHELVRQNPGVPDRAGDTPCLSAEAKARIKRRLRHPRQ